jgi:hypothetical protein
VLTQKRAAKKHYTITEDDAREACQLAFGGEMSEDDLPTSASSTGSPPVGSAGPTQYSRNKSAQWYTGQGQPYNPVGQARSPMAGDDPPPFRGMPMTGGRMQGQDSNISFLRVVADEIHQKALNRKLGSDGKSVVELLTQRDMALKFFQVDHMSQGMSDKRCQSLNDFDAMARRGEKRIAKDSSLHSLDTMSPRQIARTLSRCPGLAKIGRV